MMRITFNQLVPAFLSLLLFCSHAGAVEVAPSNEASGLKVLSVESLPALDAAFRSSKSWLGADSAYSFEVGKERSLWLFGDTFISDKGDGKRRGMIHSSVGYLTGGAVNPKFRFLCSGFDTPGSTHSRHHDPKVWWWPGDGVVVDDKLYEFVKVVRQGDNPAAGEWNFEWSSDLCVSFDHADYKDVSIVRASTSLPEQNRGILFGIACAQDDKYCYVYCSSIKDAQKLSPHPCAVARMEKSCLNSCLSSDWSYWNQAKQTWSASRDDASILFADAAAEMTVSYLKSRDMYVAVYMPPLSDKIMLRTSRLPQGPFSAPIEIYNCPEAKEQVNGKPVNVYSAKAHPELSQSPDDLVITYCTNPGDLKEHQVRPDLYYPRALVVRFAENVH